MASDIQYSYFNNRLTMARKFTLTFIPCSPAPANGYNVLWRPVGSVDPYIDAGNFSSSPIEITDPDGDPDTQYEGILRSDCGDGIFGSDIPFVSTATCCDPSIIDATVEDFPTELVFEFDDIANTPVADPTDVSQWNTFFQTSMYASTPFTSVVIVGNKVFLYGATNMLIYPGLFEFNNHILSVVDEAYVVSNVSLSVFFGCVNLIKAHFPGATYIGQNAFYSCSNLVDVNISGAITIAAGVFYFCSSLTDLYCPNCTSIGLAGCSDTNLINAFFPLVTDIDVQAFGNCPLTGSIDFSSLATTSLNSFYNCKFVNPSFPNLLTIGDNCFEGCNYLSVHDLSIATTVGNYAFKSCLALTDLKLNSVTSLGATTGDDGVFDSISGITMTLTILTATSTDGDVVYLTSNNTVTLITV